MVNNKILYIGNLLLPDGDAASHRVMGNAKALRELGYQVSFLGCQDGVEHNKFEKKQFNGFDIYLFRNPDSIKSWFRYLFSYNWFKQIIGMVSPGAIVLYNYPAIAMSKLIGFCRKEDIKIYSDCTEWFLTPGFSPSKILKRLDTLLRMKRYHLKMDGLIAISSFLEEYYSSRGVQTICVPPLVDKGDKKWIVESSEKQGMTRELVYVGNPGSGLKDKLNDVIAALDRIVSTYPSINVHFSVIGISKEEYTIRFAPLSDRMNKLVSFKGRLPNTQSLDYIKKSDYTIFLRDANLVTMAGFPTKFSESIACGTPVLTNNTSDIGKYLINGKNGFLLNISSFDSLCSTLYDALSVTAEQIKEMKDYCLTDRTFDYNSFIKVFEILFPCQKKY